MWSYHAANIPFLVNGVSELDFYHVDTIIHAYAQKSWSVVTKINAWYVYPFLYTVFVCAYVIVWPCLLGVYPKYTKYSIQINPRM